MQKSKSSVPNFLMFAAIALMIYSLVQFTGLFEDYSTISRVNVTVVEMIEEGKSLAEIKEYTNNEILGYNGKVYIGEKALDFMSDEEFLEVKDEKVKVEIFYSLKLLPFNLANTSRLTMLSKR